MSSPRNNSDPSTHQSNLSELRTGSRLKAVGSGLVGLGSGLLGGNLIYAISNESDTLGTLHGIAMAAGVVAVGAGVILGAAGRNSEAAAQQQISQMPNG